MSLINKLKNILFEEEEVEIPVLEKKEESKKRVEEIKKSTTINSFYDDLSPIIDEEKKYESNAKPVASEPTVPKAPVYAEEPRREPVNSRNEYHNEKTFNFPSFDEEEFEQATPKPRSTNVLEYERKKVEKKAEIRKNSTPNKVVVKKKEEVKDNSKFRPSPIISPVYGILDKNYTPDEITSRKATYSDSKNLDVDSVRKKAFGPFEEAKYEAPKRVEPPKEEIKFDERIYEEKLEKARTIDELLKDSSDDVISIPEETLPNIDIPNNTLEEDSNIDTLTNVDIFEETQPLPLREKQSYNISNYEDNNQALENIEPKHEENFEDDTLESDLFDLIDSMYENREDGE